MHVLEESVSTPETKRSGNESHQRKRPSVKGRGSTAQQIHDTPTQPRIDQAKTSKRSSVLNPKGSLFYTTPVISFFQILNVKHFHFIKTTKGNKGRLHLVRFDGLSNSTLFFIFRSNSSGNIFDTHLIVHQALIYSPLNLS